MVSAAPVAEWAVSLCGVAGVPVNIRIVSDWFLELFRSGAAVSGSSAIPLSMGLGASVAGDELQAWLIPSRRV